QGRVRTVARLRLRAHIMFFFSSRRRHTRFSRDWSSDVCSSDLGGTTPCSSTWHRPISWNAAAPPLACPVRLFCEMTNSGAPSERSEERRVGKEGRSRGRGGDRKTQSESNRQSENRRQHRRRAHK